MACDSQTVLMLHCNGSDGGTSFVDSSLVPHTMTANGSSVTSVTQKKFGSASLKTTGSVSDTVTTGDSSDWNFDGDVTIDFWLYLTSLPGTDSSIGLIGQKDDASNYWSLSYYETTTDLRFLIRNGGAQVTVVHGSWVITTGTWHHVAYVRSGNTHYLFIDGVQLASNTDTTRANNFTSNLVIGGMFDKSLNGYMDEIRISKGIARWVSNFTPSTSEYCVDTISDINFRANMRGVGCGICRGMFYSNRNFEKNENGLYLINKKICLPRGMIR